MKLLELLIRGEASKGPTWNHVEEPTHCNFLTKYQVTTPSLLCSHGTSLDTDLGGTRRGCCLGRIHLGQVVDFENFSFLMR